LFHQYMLWLYSGRCPPKLAGENTGERLNDKKACLRTLTLFGSFGKRSLNESLVEKGASRAGFEVFFKSICFVFVSKCDVCNQF
jgi:hypothetical protein